MQTGGKMKKFKSSRSTGFFVRGIFILVAWAILAGGCGLGDGGGGTATSSTTTTTAGGSAAEAIITDQPAPAAVMAAGALGSITFTVDSDRTASVSYPADGQASRVDVTDGSGLTWRLDIPGDALAAPVTITMSALKDLASASMPGVINGGVLLEPDGLQFLTPATLTVTPPAGRHVGVILIGRHDGTGIEFAPSTAGQDNVSAQISHFSTGSSTSTDDAAIDALRKRALADYESAKAAATELLKQSNVSVPPPPDIKLNCWGTSAYKDPEAILVEYEQSVFSPERDIASRLLGTGRSLALLGEDAKSVEAVKMAADVHARIVKKTRLLVKTYAPQPEKFTAVLRAALTAERQNQLLGGPEDSSTMTALANWAGKALDFYIDELRVKHDYTVVPALYYIARIAALLGASGSDTALDRIVNALTFTAYFDTAAVFKGANTLQYHLNGNVTIDRMVNAWQGTANGKYVDFTSSKGDVTMALPNLFPVTAKIENMDACVNNTVDVFISAIGADSEMYISAKGSAPASPGEIKTLAFGMLFEKYDQPTSTYKFHMPLTNLDTEAAREIFANSYGGKADFQYDLKLWHSPK